MYIEVETIEKALDKAREFISMGFDISISDLKNGLYAVSSIEK